MTSQSIKGECFLDIEMLDARNASALRKIISSTSFRKRVSVEEQRAQKYNRFMRGRQIAHVICGQSLRFGGRAVTSCHRSPCTASGHWIRPLPSACRPKPTGKPIGSLVPCRSCKLGFAQLALLDLRRMRSALHLSAVMAAVFSVLKQPPDSFPSICLQALSRCAPVSALSSPDATVCDEPRSKFVPRQRLVWCPELG